MKYKIIVLCALLIAVLGLFVFRSHIMKSMADTAPSVTPTPNGKVYPANILNLTNWKLTIPMGDVKDATEIKQPELATYELDPWFMPTSDKTGVKFRAPVNAVTTKGSNYPRSELREMTNNGMTNASWSSTSGTHTMIVDEAVTAVPTFKKHIVTAQIHDDSDDILVIRLEYPHLYVNVGGKNKYTLDNNYTLGKRYTIKLVVSAGQTKVYYNGATTPSYTYTKKYSNSYFKAGAYTQSNCSREVLPWLCTADNYGEVTIYHLSVTHQ